MAKNRNKKKKTGADSMDTTETTVSDNAQAMDTSEPGASRPASGGLNRIQQKGRPMKRSKNVRKKKALEKAISKTEQSFEKVAKFQNKKERTLSAKQLYD